MTTKTRFDITLNDVMHNASRRETHNEAKFSDHAAGQICGRGIIVGVVATLMASGMEFKTALHTAINHCKDVDLKCVPEYWHKELPR